jgi:hypothetical protein
MKITLLLIGVFFISCPEASESEDFPSSLELFAMPAMPLSDIDSGMGAIFRTLSEKAVYFGAGTLLGSASFLTQLGWGISLLFPWSSTAGNECLLLSHVLDCAAQHAFAQTFKAAPSLSSFFKGIPHSHSSWFLNQMLLSRVPAVSSDERELLIFLQKRWLAKSTGFYSTLVDWISPCFGIIVQVHPESTNSYSRDPWDKFSQTYLKAVRGWKQTLPHDFPLILIRPSAIQGYLPPCIDVSLDENIQTTLERLALKLQAVDSKVIVDMTDVFPNAQKDREQWLRAWKAYQGPFSQACKQRNLNPDRILTIQRLQQQEIGGICLLPLVESSAKELEQHHQYLLEWIARFGLSANRIELDRCAFSSSIPLCTPNAPLFSPILQPKEEFLSDLNSFNQNGKLDHPQKTLMLEGTLQTLKELLAILPDETWNEVANNPTRSSIVQLSFLKIKEQLQLLAQEKEDVSFFDTASHVEQIHAHISALLEIFAPFSYEDFPQIYQEALASIPADLKPLTSYAVHTAGMTSLAGIFKAVERSFGRPPRILYGENTYFENIYAAEKISHASAIEDAIGTDWEDVDLILAQFNPALRRIDFKITEYQVERVADALRNALNPKRENPLILAIDCTLDFIDSPRVSNLLTEFQQEIKKGALNVICYRSGIKYDLFGMDNYCGAPFYMIHNQDPKWVEFDLLTRDPALQTDRLSLNWFCLAYKSAVPYLEHYRKQIFANTRALLNRLPSRLLNNNTRYRVVPIDQSADPAFIDIKVFGPFHQIRGSLLVGGFLTMKCMEKGHPIFYRPSLGFYHPNFSMLFADNCTTIRLTLGLDPAQVDVLVSCFEMLDTLNGSSWDILRDKLLIISVK